MEDFGKGAVFAVGMVVFVIWRASVTADRLEATAMPGRGSNRGLYFWGALILFACILGGVIVSRFAAGQ